MNAATGAGTMVPAGEPSHKRSRQSLAWRLWRSISERTMISLITLCGISAIIFVFGIFYFIFREGASFLGDGFDFKGFFLSKAWYPTSESNPRFGILALISGSASVTMLAIVFAVPFGLGTAVYISDFCGKRTKETLKILVELLAAVPSVVWGFIGMMVIGPFIMKAAAAVHLSGPSIGVNVLNAGIVVGLMVVPVIVSISEDSIRAVPDDFRAAAEALGATRWQVIYKVIFPAAKSGLLASVLLGVGRAVGETMAVLMCTGNSVNVPFDGAFPYFHPLQSVQTLTATIAAELGEAPSGGRHYQALFVIGMVLFAITFAINLTADLVVRGIRIRK
jgi:phosphate transport system permease protein